MTSPLRLAVALLAAAAFASSAETQTTRALTRTIVAWNIEHLDDNGERGFPESERGGPVYGSRKRPEYRALARVVRDKLGAAVVLLSEINGRPGSTKSDELERLVEELGDGWHYRLAASGGRQRIAILHNERLAKRGRCVELTIPKKIIEGKDIAERDPLACQFVLLDDHGRPQNDLVAVGVHWAALQHLTANHDAAMRALRDRLTKAVRDGTFEGREADILIGGDFNASRYDKHHESFWDGFDREGFGFQTLAPIGSRQYRATRLTGVPLKPRSKIDYFLASRGMAAELSDNRARVRTELLPEDLEEYRRQLSDHLPISIDVRVSPDDD